MKPLPGDSYRVLWVTSAYPYEESLVAGIFVKEHAHAARLLDKITILHLLERQSTIHSLWEIDVPAQEEHRVIPLVRVRARQNALPFSTFPVHIVSAFRGLRECQRISGPFDLVHAHSYRAGVSAALIAKKLRVPLLITEHNSIFLRKALHGFEYHKAAFAYRSAVRILPVSTALQRAIQDYGFSTQSQVIGNTFDPEVFFPGPVNRELEKLHLITVTNLIPLKGVSTLLQALKNVSSRLPEWDLLIIGDGPERSSLIQQASELGLLNQISFSGMLTKPQIAEALRGSHLYILSSSHETFSVATLEALACGVPVLATACGGPEDFITPEVGILIPPNNQTAMENELVKVVSRIDQFDRNKIAQIIRSRYSYTAIGEQIHQAYHTVLLDPVKR